MPGSNTSASIGTALPQPPPSGTATPLPTLHALFARDHAVSGGDTSTGGALLADSTQQRRLRLIAAVGVFAFEFDATAQTYRAHGKVGLAVLGSAVQYQILLYRTRNDHLTSASVNAAGSGTQVYRVEEEDEDGFAANAGSASPAPQPRAAHAAITSAAATPLTATFTDASGTRWSLRYENPTDAETILRHVVWGMFLSRRRAALVTMDVRRGGSRNAATAAPALTQADGNVGGGKPVTLNDVVELTLNNWTNATVTTGNDHHSAMTSDRVQCRVGDHALMKGLDQSVLGMRVGGRRVIAIPAVLAYSGRGHRSASGSYDGSGGSRSLDLPPNTDLLLEITVHSISSLPLPALRPPTSLAPRLEVDGAQLPALPRLPDVGIATNASIGNQEEVLARVSRMGQSYTEPQLQQQRQQHDSAPQPQPPSALTTIPFHGYPYAHPYAHPFPPYMIASAPYPSENTASLTHARIDDLHRKIDALAITPGGAADPDRLLPNLATVLRQLSAAREDLDKKSIQVSALQEQLEQLAASLTAAEEEKRTWMERCAKEVRERGRAVERVLEQSREDAGRAEDVLLEVTRRERALKEEVASLKTNQRRVELEVELEERADALRKERDNMKRMADMERERAKAQHAAHTDAAARYVADIAALEKTALRRQEELDVMHKTTADLQRQLDLQTQALAQSQHDVKNLRTGNSTLSQDLAATSKKLRHVQSQPLNPTTIATSLVDLFTTLQADLNKDITDKRECALAVGRVRFRLVTAMEEWGVCADGVKEAGNVGLSRSPSAVRRSENRSQTSRRSPSPARATATHAAINSAAAISFSAEKKSPSRTTLSNDIELADEDPTLHPRSLSPSQSSTSRGRSPTKRPLTATVTATPSPSASERAHSSSAAPIDDDALPAQLLTPSRMSSVSPTKKSGRSVTESSSRPASLYLPPSPTKATSIALLDEEAAPASRNILFDNEGIPTATRNTLLDDDERMPNTRTSLFADVDDASVKASSSRKSSFHNRRILFADRSPEPASHSYTMDANARSALFDDGDDKADDAEVLTVDEETWLFRPAAAAAGAPLFEPVMLHGSSEDIDRDPLAE